MPDVCTDTSDALLIAALARALVDTAACDWVAGRAAPEVSVGLLRAAAWRAARFGMTGELVDTTTAETVPAWTRFDQLVDHVAGALTSNQDYQRVRRGAQRLQAAGTGSEFQRWSYSRHGEFTDVVFDAADRTLAIGSDDD